MRQPGQKDGAEGMRFMFFGVFQEIMIRAQVVSLGNEIRENLSLAIYSTSICSSYMHKHPMSEHDAHFGGFWTNVNVITLPTLATLIIIRVQ